MSDGVFTNEYRFILEKGEVTSGSPSPGFVACGPGTAYPLKVSLDQLAEIFYRVRDAKMSGEVTAAYSFTTFNLAFSGGDMPADYYSGTSSDCIIQRAYADTESPPANLTQERKIWIGPLSSPAPIFPTYYLTHGVITGFTHYAESFVFPLSGYYPYGYNTGGGGVEYTAQVELAFGGRVAWVDITESGNPFDSGNELWIELGFYCRSEDAVAALADAYTLATGNPNEGASGDLAFILSSGSVSCQLYASNSAFASTTSSLTITATEWWPYAKGIPSTPVWKFDDGTRLP